MRGLRTLEFEPADGAYADCRFEDDDDDDDDDAQERTPARRS